MVERLGDFKINELQLYTEHTFAYRRYRAVWRDWGALTAREIRTLDARCRELGIDLVSNQNSFGHLRQWLEFPPLKKLAEVGAPYEDGNGTFLRYPSTLAPNHPGTLPFLRGLYDLDAGLFVGKLHEQASKIEVSLPRLLHSLARNVPGFVDYFCEEQGIDLAGEQRRASL